jgi:hypothetical protein
MTAQKQMELQACTAGIVEKVGSNASVRWWRMDPGSRTKRVMAPFDDEWDGVEDAVDGAGSV